MIALMMGVNVLSRLYVYSKADLLMATRAMSTLRMRSGKSDVREEVLRGQPALCAIE